MEQRYTFSRTQKFSNTFRSEDIIAQHLPSNRQAKRRKFWHLGPSCMNSHCNAVSFYVNPFMPMSACRQVFVQVITTFLFASVFWASLSPGTLEGFWRLREGGRVEMHCVFNILGRSAPTHALFHTHSILLLPCIIRSWDSNLLLSVLLGIVL